MPVELVAAALNRDNPEKSFDCEACGLRREGYRPDPCIGGYLPGVSHACCGHGGAKEAYVALGGEADQCAWQVEDLVTLRGAPALAYLAEHRHLATAAP